MICLSTRRNAIFDLLLHLRNLLIGEHGKVVFAFGGGEHAFVLDTQADEQIDEAVIAAIGPWRGRKGQSRSPGGEPELF